MKALHILFVACSMFAYQTLALAASSSMPRNEAVATQQSMSDQSCQAYQQEDTEMNSLYQHLKKTYQQDRDFLRHLKKAQKYWLKFRDAHVYSMYPRQHKRNRRFGSNVTMCRCILLATMTKTRNDQLREMLMPAEGDVCALLPPVWDDREDP